VIQSLEKVGTVRIEEGESCVAGKEIYPFLKRPATRY
jgi:hypothetical protein